MRLENSFGNLRKLVVTYTSFKNSLGTTSVKKTHKGLKKKVISPMINITALLQTWKKAMELWEREGISDTDPTQNNLEQIGNKTGRIRDTVRNWEFSDCRNRLEYWEESWKAQETYHLNSREYYLLLIE